jgi:hypothetical protein
MSIEARQLDVLASYHIIRKHNTRSSCQIDEQTMVVGVVFAKAIQIYADLS